MLSKPNSKITHWRLNKLRRNYRQFFLYTVRVLSKNLQHKFHIVSSSCLPFLTALSSFFLVSNFVFYWNRSDDSYVLFVDSLMLHLSMAFFSTIIILWLNTVVIESNMGYHTPIVQKGLRLGVVLFIVSEIMFFFSLFWAFFHYSLSPADTFGHLWPPHSTQLLNIWGLPFTNTVLLLSSGATITLAHHSILDHESSFSLKNFKVYLASTIILGITFLFCQWIEYTYGVSFRWTDNVYGSVFFITTGFHGFHVLLGTYGLLFCFERLFSSSKNKLYDNRFSKTQHLGFEAALWYWHFVDVVWIFLFCAVYWWTDYPSVH